MAEGGRNRPNRDGRGLDRPHAEVPGMKILVLDDSPMMRKLIRRSLEKIDGIDAEILEAGDGAHGLSALEEHGTSVDLVLCDLNMPNMDGLAFMEILSSRADLATIPVVFVTADRSDENVRQAVRIGAAGVLGKPLDPAELAEVVREVNEVREAREAREVSESRSGRG